MIFQCTECGEETTHKNRICVFCDDDFDDDFEGTEMTVADEAAYERYKERSDFDYWHRGEK